MMPRSASGSLLARLAIAIAARARQRARCRLKVGYVSRLQVAARIAHLHVQHRTGVRRDQAGRPDLIDKAALRQHDAALVERIDFAGLAGARNAEYR